MIIPENSYGSLFGNAGTDTVSTPYILAPNRSKLVTFTIESLLGFDALGDDHTLSIG
ncbi:hypothetical protein D3C87_1329650 [compost metagenome]